MAVFVFDAVGDGVTITAPTERRRQWRAHAPRPGCTPWAWRGRRGLSVTGIRGVDCCHVYAGPSATSYEAVRMTGYHGQHRPRHPHPRRRRAVPRPCTTRDGACYLAYVQDCQVDGAQYENMTHGVQWWGGDAEISRDGAFTNERKCRGIVIRNVMVRNVTGGIWGSMGRDVVVQDCRVDGCDDVAFDAEGSTNVLFERCVARNARNGCFTTFFYCDGVRFVDCDGQVDDRAFSAATRLQRIAGQRRKPKSGDTEAVRVHRSHWGQR